MFSSSSEDEEDSTTIELHLQCIAAEMKKNKPNISVVEDRMHFFAIYFLT